MKSHYNRTTAFGCGLCSLLIILVALWPFHGRSQTPDMKKKDSNDGQSGTYAFPSDPRVMEMVSKMTREDTLVGGQVSGRRAGTLGYLSICLVKNPEKWSDTQLESSEWLNTVFEGRDKDALFDEVIEKYGDKSYPLLSRINDLYADVVFSEAEIRPLLEECESALRVTEDPSAILAVKKMRDAASGALDRKSGIILASA